MKPQKRPVSPLLLKISATPKSLLAVVLSCTCGFSLGVDVSACKASSRIC
jgi:hypothetical protein